MLISVDELTEAMLSDHPPVMLDVRWALGDSHGHDHYRDGHIPGAVYVDLDTELAAPPSPEWGRHPLPELADLQRAARRWGIDDGSRVVVYDDTGNLASARAWWLLRWAGHQDVRMLDGGLGAWIAAGLRLSSGDATPRTGNVTLSAGHLPVVDIDDVASTRATIVDARAAERYRGEVEPVDPRAGHIPGAISAPTVGNLAPDGTFLPAHRLRERFSALGIGDDDVIAYCGSGVNAAHEIAALELAGYTATLFPGSWSQWSADPGRPAETGR
ncbi:sulfurtransferase [Gordonia rhizosphera]|uniref:Putative 3-mercaptopyruvate sulfurtransferase n=1 Tax=Gordonia rhizosphera NBRC 16068 TaxID=1108045 RepID=K6VWF6_9ACTN|nr:sulfurtransferase [Gordonia rhizosphera]GAB91240.1 putative 3-mercaptopyruvate sulfurtransferase [Gordonia rhizosphera NBRC 16068]